LPILFLLIFASVFSANHVKVSGGRLSASVVYVPGIMTLGIIAASFVNLFISVTAQRETGVLKRRRATHNHVGDARPRQAAPPISLPGL
jgi:ABC-2 type transport system permease protein